jgi:hypothetical protein
MVWHIEEGKQGQWKARQSNVNIFSLPKYSLGGKGTAYVGCEWMFEDCWRCLTRESRPGWIPDERARPGGQ